MIFFLQVKYHYPTVAQCLVVTSTDCDYKPVLGQFFKFYLSKYQMTQQIISANIGQWQQMHPNLQTNHIQRNNPVKIRFVLFYTVLTEINERLALVRKK